MNIATKLANTIIKLAQNNSNLEKQLYADTVALAMPKGRRVGQPGNKIAQAYLIERLEELGLEPFAGDSFELPYEGELYQRLRKYNKAKKHTFMNLVGVAPGSNRDLPPLLIGAHYDSVIDAPCADDNATSVALNLAIAEMAMTWEHERDIIIALFDAEEPPYFLSKNMGSTRFYEDHCQGIDFAGVIVTDLIGHDLVISDMVEVPTLVKPLIPDTKKILFMTGAESDGIFPEIVEDIASRHKDLKIFPTLNSYIGNMSDHHAFEKDGQPFLFFSCAQGKYYHHKLDTIDWINFPKLAHITNFISEIIWQLDETPAGEDLDAKDPAEFEIRMIKKVVGPKKVTILAKTFNFPLPTDREGIDDLIGSLTGTVV